MISTVWSIINSKDNSSPAILAPYGNPLTYGEFKSQALHTAYQLYNYGLNKDSKVAIVAYGPEMAVMTMAAMSFFVANPFSLNSKARELEKYFQLCDPSVLVAMEGCQEALEAAKNVRIPIIYLKQRHNGFVGSFSLFNQHSRELNAKEAAITFPSPDDRSLFLLTSGATADPKVVLLKHRNLYAAAKGLAEDMGLNSKDMGLNPGMPLHHAGALCVNLLTSFYAGGSVYLLPEWGGGKSFANTITQNPITWMSGIDGHYRSIALSCKTDGGYRNMVKNHQMKVLRIGSTPSTGELIDMIANTFPNARPFVGYGLTEAPGYIGYMLTPDDIAEHRKSKNNNGFLCRLPHSGLDIKIIGDDGNPVPEGTPGEMVIKGSKVTDGYLVTPSNPQVNEASYTADGYLKTGDLVVQRNVALYLVGRCKDVIRYHAETIIPAEVEDVLKSHEPLLKDRPVYVFGIPNKLDEYARQAVAVVIQLDEESLSDKGKVNALCSNLKTICQDNLQGFKIPTVWIFTDKVPTAGQLNKITRNNMHNAFGLRDMDQVGKVRRELSSFTGPLIWLKNQLQASEVIVRG